MWLWLFTMPANPGLLNTAFQFINSFLNGIFISFPDYLKNKRVLAHFSVTEIDAQGKGAAREHSIEQGNLNLAFGTTPSHPSIKNRPGCCYCEYSGLHLHGWNELRGGGSRDYQIVMNGCRQVSFLQTRHGHISATPFCQPLAQIVLDTKFWGSAG